MKKVSCPECKKGVLIQRRGEYETEYLDRHEQGQRLIVPGVAWLECDACGEVVLDDYGMSVIEGARRKALGILSPEEIRALRKGLRRTQTRMSELLGIGEKTYCRWESGSYIQSEAFDRYLRLLIAEPRIAELLERIAAAKAQPQEQGETSPEESRLFCFISDLAAVKERARVFADLMMNGELHAA